MIIPLLTQKTEDLSFLEDSISSSASQESPIPENRDEKVTAVFAALSFAKKTLFLGDWLFRNNLVYLFKNQEIRWN